jgi:hypothetical protein
MDVSAGHERAQLDSTTEQRRVGACSADWQSAVLPNGIRQAVQNGNASRIANPSRLGGSRLPVCATVVLSRACCPNGLMVGRVTPCAPALPQEHGEFRNPDSGGGAHGVTRPTILGLDDLGNTPLTLPPKEREPSRLAAASTPATMNLSSHAHPFVAAADGDRPRSGAVPGCAR